MSIVVRLAVPDWDAADLHRLTVDLCRALGEHAGVDATLPQAAGPGAKGDPITVGAIVLAVVTSGALAALFDVFKTYFQRKSSLAITLEGSNGKKLVLHAENLSSERVAETMALAQKVLGGGE